MKSQIELLLEQRDIGWREDTKRVGILFSDALIEGFSRPKW